MGLFDKLKGGKAKELVEEHGDEIKKGVDKATDMADEKTGGQYSEHLDTVDDKAKDVIDDMGDGKK